MGNYRELQKYLERNGNTVIKLSFGNLKDILGIEVNYAVAIRLQRDFRCSYIVDGISERGKWVGFRKIEAQTDDGATIATTASMLWW